MRLRRLFVLLCATLALAACARPVQRYAATRWRAPSSMRGCMARRSRNPMRSRRVAQVVPVAADLSRRALHARQRRQAPHRGVRPGRAVQQLHRRCPGRVTLPLVGAVEARGLTTAQLGGAIAGRLKQSYIRDPSVAVEVETYRPFFVLGEVTFPGPVSLRAEHDGARTPSPSPAASRRAPTATRSPSPARLQGVPTRFKLPLRYPLRPGDTVEISERWF